MLAAFLRKLRNLLSWNETEFSQDYFTNDEDIEDRAVDDDDTKNHLITVAEMGHTQIMITQEVTL